ncbi:hypothetical protein HOP50_03g27460 [Chloropicon primus]|uniref:Uncharacterized protein n=1 Tax=Chloropicon primus TaxID=1764295 RepID=A0A5B8MHW9_9CHLO|nr:hypothetical protein A3770_03p27460 [Chloropicon primus]UPQ99438.1 hypothetical protein HOP50_03g27460 [Chloropicon primus]|eukprot:QDZ20228.1 hypothetical protein A3770_03p27460 [Chloropicon primus]
MTMTGTRRSTWKMLRGAGLALAVGLAGATIAQGAQCLDGSDDNCLQCAAEADNPWCGGTQDPVNEMSCTPFTYRPMSFNNLKGLNEWCGFGDDDIYKILAYDDSTDDQGNPAPWPYPGVRAWAAQFNNDCSQAGGNKDYWVFHACDGAGIQGGDCAGDIKYVERFGFHYDGAREDKGICTPDGQGVGYDNRKYCKFVHPGTEKVYDDYKAGWTGINNPDEDTFWAAAGLPSCENAFNSKASKGWADDSALMQTLSTFPSWAYGGEHPYAYTGQWFSFPMYSWRAVKNGNDNHYLSYPTIAENGWKAFADNEPCGDSKDYCAGAPPVVDFIIAGLDQADGNPKIVFDMWRSDADGNMMKLNDGGEPFVLYPVHENDGSCAPW